MPAKSNQKISHVKKYLYSSASISAAFLMLHGNALQADDGADNSGAAGQTAIIVPAASAKSLSAASQEIKEDNRYTLRLITQVYNGKEDLSHTQILGLSRVRRGNRSYSQFDFGDGSVVKTGDDGISAGRFLNISAAEQAFEYDYSTKKVGGNGGYARFHNGVVRPWLGKGPDLDSDARWTTSIPISAFGTSGLSGGDVNIELSREYFEYDGKPMVLVHYLVPAFSYNLDGKMVVQWGRGLSLTDPGFGQIYINAALHRSAVRKNGSVGNPYRYARTMVAANPDGSAMIDYRKVPQLAPYIDKFFSKKAIMVVPNGPAVQNADERPLVLAQNMDLMALSIGEDGANEVPFTAGAQTSGDRGDEVGAFGPEYTNLTHQQVKDLGWSISDWNSAARRNPETMKPLPPLPSEESILSGLEGFDDLNEVKPITSAEARKASEDAGARAYTDGTNVFGDTGTSGNSTFAEEVIHQTQAGGGGPASTSGEEAAASYSPTGGGSIRGGPSGGGSVGNLADEVSPETLRELNAQSGNGSQDPVGDAFKRVSGGGGGATFGGKDPAKDDKSNLEKAVEYIKFPADVLGKETGITGTVILPGIDKLKSDVTPILDDLFNVSGDAAQRVNAANSNLQRALDAQKNALAVKEALITSDFNLDPKDIFAVDTDVINAEKAVQQAIGEANASRKALETVTQAGGRLKVFLDKLPTETVSDLVEAFGDSKFGKGLDVLSHGLNALSVGESGLNVYKASTSDLSSGKLPLSGSYVTLDGKTTLSDVTAVGGLGLNIISLLGNAYAGNAAGALSDASALTVGSITDLYIVNKALNDTYADNKRRNKELIANLEKLTAKMGEQAQQELAALRAEEVGLYTSEQTSDGGVSDPNWEDSRFDPDTGLPASDEIWAAMKKSPGGRDLLRRRGIDPDAPVGSLTKAPDVPSAPKKPVKVVYKTPSLGGGPDYPTRTRDEVVIVEKKEEILPPTRLSDAQIAEIERNQRQQKAKEELDALQKKKLAEQRKKDGLPPLAELDEYETAEERKAGAEADLKELQDKKLAEQRKKDGLPPIAELDEYETPEERRAAEQAKLDAQQEQRLKELKEQRERDKKLAENEESQGSRESTLEITELVVSEFDIKPVNFDPPKFIPPQFIPPEWVPPEFDPPEISNFPPTDPNDTDGYPGTGEYPAFGYDNLSGTVETDLSKWGEWLDTQNVAELERLALQAGYPNLASALADGENIIRQSQDSGYRQWSFRAPSCGGIVGCGPSYLERWAMKRSIVALGDILVDSRGIFSSGGFSDIGISGFNLTYTLTDFGIQDGDLVDVEITQFGRPVFSLEGHLLLTAGSTFNANLSRGVAQVVVTALNEGTASPNTAAVSINDVVRGTGAQNFSLNTRETAVLRVEAGATAE